MVHSFVITGFLGVGKTTMLTNTVKEHFSDKNIAIIVNEFGDVGVDSKLLKNVHSEVLEISEGCICCKLAEEFEAGVIEILHKYKPELLFVETSGASEPFPIFMSLQNLGICVEGVICVVDVKNFDKYKENTTSKYQLGGSNIIILNKTDLVTQSELEDISAEILDIKEKYNLKNNLTSKPIFKNYIVKESVQGIVDSNTFEGLYKVEEVIELSKEDKHLDHTEKDSITQKVLYVKEVVTFSQLDKLLKNLPTNIYRAKGVVKVSDVETPLFFNYSFGDTSYEELPSYTEQSIIILIGESIEKDVPYLIQEHNFLNLPLFRVKK
jgi:G3E family GTPase